MAIYRRLTAAALPLTGLVAVAGIVAPAHAQLANINPAQSGSATLKVLTPRAGDSIGANTFSLDVSFRSRTGSPIVTAELYVDGVRWVRRNLDAPQIKNVLSFEVDATSLEAGMHTFLIKVYDVAGGSAQTETRVQAGVSGGVSEGTGGPALRFIGPGNGAKVSGVVELNIDAESRNGINPYVSFYVDDQFKTLKNYAPYSYAWDTTTVENGFHTIEAKGFLESGRDTTTRRIRVYVDNPGGETKKKSVVANLAKPETTTSAVVKSPSAGSIAPSLSLDFASARISPSTPVVRSTAKPIGLKSMVSATAMMDIAPIAPITAPSVVVAPRIPKAPAKTSASESLTVKPTEAIAKPVITSMNAAPTVSVSRSVRSMVTMNLSPVVPMAKSSLMAPVPVAPQRVTVSAPSPAVPLKAKTRRTTNAAPGAVVLPGGMAAFDRRTLAVAFDGQRIAFDVQPRVEAGMPLAPFRHIFEHTGGQVMWIAKTHVVRAVNADREIIIKVGGKSATVNGQQVTMDKAAFIEKGRTIVPLSFVGQALDVNIKYDPATGHLDITSK